MAITRESATRVTAEVLPGLPRGPLSPRQQLEAVRRAQAQAEQRVKLGMQLFKAAESRTSHHRDLLEQVKSEQSRLREQITQDVTKTLHQYDQWIGGIDESFTGAMRAMEERMTKLETQFSEKQAILQQMVSRTESLLNQAQKLLAGPESPTPSEPRP